MFYYNIAEVIYMLPPGCIILDKNHFFYYDHHKSSVDKSMKDGHYHNFYEIYYLISGECDYFIDDAIYSVEPNGLIFIPNNVIHKAVYKTDHYERIVLSFTGDYIDPLISDNLTDVFICNLKNKKDVDYFRYTFDNICSCSCRKDELSQLLLRCYITQILAYIAENFSNGSRNLITNQSPINDALSFISKNYSQNITLEQVAAESGYNKDYFSKLFKKITGTGFKEYVLLTRLNAAEKLITTSTKSIKEIAMLCGFNDSNHFSSVFKKFYNSSPKKYKHLKNTM